MEDTKLVNKTSDVSDIQEEQSDDNVEDNTFLVDLYINLKRSYTGSF